uniref:Pericentrin/AKAP-450 centrosomal targeting domain-containing protein n=1 Tax=Magallana gigas TaxID=29159 RepID=A0A8W8M5T7_MAGGI
MKFSDLTQQVQNLESSETRECDMEATQELQLEKLHSTHQHVDSKSSEEDPVHWNVYKSQLESLKTDGGEDGATQHTGEFRGGDLEIQSERRRIAGKEKGALNVRHVNLEINVRLWIQCLYGKYLRADSYRKALVYQKKYLLLLLGGFQDCEQTTLALIARMGVYPSPEDLQRGTRPRRPVTAFRSAARAVVAVTRSVCQTGHHGQECPLVGYAPNSNSFSPPRINTQSRVNGSGPFNSHASSPLHSSVHQSPYSPSYLSSSFTQRDLLNGASPYHSLGGASSGYHVNSNGVTNGISSYQSVGGISDSYHVNSNFSVHTTPPTRDYSSKPHPTSENSGARRKILSSSSPNPTKVGHSSPARRVRISEPSSNDDYICRLENLQQRLSGMDSGE